MFGHIFRAAQEVRSSAGDKLNNSASSVLMLGSFLPCVKLSAAIKGVQTSRGALSLLGAKCGDCIL